MNIDLIYANFTLFNIFNKNSLIKIFYFKSKINII